MAYQYPMERVLYNLHQKACTFALRRTTGKSRNLTEQIVLLLAVCGFGALLLLHVSFVYRGRSNFGMNMMGEKTIRSIPLACLPSVKGFRPDADVTHVSLIKGGESYALQVTTQKNHSEHGREIVCFSDNCFTLDKSEIFYSFSRVKGFVMLPTSTYYTHNISTQYVMISKTDDKCFGEPFLQRLIFGLVGPDTVIINWFLATYDGEGSLHNPRTQTTIDLSVYKDNENTPWHRQLGSKLVVVVKASFLFFITTTLVSFTLRETQERMLDFTYQLQAHVRARRPVVNLVMTHLIDNLVFCPVMVGMVFFLIEFYRGDKILAFMVLSIVWICEVFSVISLRSTQGVHFFPRIFFLLFALFHFYLFLFPFGFSYMALTSCLCFMIHSMIFFLNRFELPAVALGHRNHSNTRMGSDASPGNESIPLGRDGFDGNILSVTIQPRLTRQLSQRSIASNNGRFSRQPSSSVLFNAGEDGDESYMFFMGGEVVMHRTHQQPSSIVGSTLDSSGHAVRTEDRRNGIPDQVLAEVGVGPVDDDIGILGAEDATPETSDFQAIYNANETPRRENLSRENTAIQSEEVRISTAPGFPMLPT